MSEKDGPALENQEIVVTPEMIAAGVAELREYDRDEGPDDAVVLSVFEAVCAEAPRPFSVVCSGRRPEFELRF